MPTSLITNALGKIYGRVSSKLDANRLYKVLVPALKEAIARDVSLDDPQMERLIDAISALPSAGAKQRNFVNRYMRDKDSMLRLPDNPDSIMFGYWW